MSLASIGYLAVSKFRGLNAEGVKALKPVTIILNGDKPLAVAVEYGTYLRMQEDLDQKLNLVERLVDTKRSN